MFIPPEVQQGQKPLPHNRFATHHKGYPSDQALWFGSVSSPLNVAAGINRKIENRAFY
jgi:hypothetical protein